MKIEPVEIYSDASNAAVMRHPGRRFPGVLVQGDTLHSIVQEIEGIRSTLPASSAEAMERLTDIHTRLNHLLQHYKAVLSTHSLELPFHEQSKS